MKSISLFFLVLLGVSQGALAEIAPTESFNQFIDRMVTQHHFQENQLKALFNAVEIQQPILDAMAKPAEAKPWFQYRAIFMNEARIQGGVEFWKNNVQALLKAEKNYGVPAEIIIAIIGVETKYGSNTGKYRVLDALSTLGFAYPKRSEFFQKELEQYLILTREEGIDPLSIMGSYAGAMGYPQFMPSSFRSYAVDLDEDHKRDIWKNSQDAIASVANYFAKNHWHPNGAIAYPVTLKTNAKPKFIGKGVKPDTTLNQLRKEGVVVPASLSGSMPAKLLQFETENKPEYWVGMNNFYVITRYNHSPLYAMAVYQLSRAIADQYKNTNPSLVSKGKKRS